MGWHASAILAVALLALIATVAYQTLLGGNRLTGRVLDAYTDKPVPDATVQIADLPRPLGTGADGTFKLDGGGTTVTVSKPGYDPAAVEVGGDGHSFDIKIRPNVVSGTVLSKATGKPIAGATVQAKIGADVVRASTTDESGHYTLADVPDGATLVVQSADFAAESLSIGRQTQLDARLRPDVLTGTITGVDGKPVAGATVDVGSVSTQTGKDGGFRLQGAPAGGSAILKAPGYRAASVTFGPSLSLSAQLQPLQVKALYASAASAGTPDKLNRLISMIDQTEANALVVDIKDSSGTVYYDSQVPLAREIGAVDPAYDARQLLQVLHQHGIYAIARLVCFEDPKLAEKHPEWAIHDSRTGGLWRDFNGLAWVNAHRSEVWDYDVALAKEAADLGFDEVQLDYVRFPSDGPLDRAQYGVPHDGKTRPQAIADFMASVHAALAPTPTYLAADVFGLTMWAADDSGIGQELDMFAPQLDYICPMVYPSHFYAGSMGFAIPNDHPYEVVLWSLKAGNAMVPGIKDKLRPWIQDFSLGPGIPYGNAEVRKQLDAASDFGSTGWLIWNPANVYHDAALKPKA